MIKPFSEACERNRGPILDALRTILADRTRVLEIGSGTGQHAVWFAAHLPHLVWQASDVAAHLPGIRAWIDEARLPNLPPPIMLDIDAAQWPAVTMDAAFTANTLHIVSWVQIERLIAQVAALLPADGVFVAYGPFKRDGMHTAESNARFDLMLRERDPLSGIRDFEAADALAARHGLALIDDRPMPANNALAVWRKAR
jgi:SAM-dependent methyltransferase